MSNLVREIKIKYCINYDIKKANSRIEKILL